VPASFEDHDHINGVRLEMSAGFFGRAARPEVAWPGALWEEKKVITTARSLRGEVSMNHATCGGATIGRPEWFAVCRLAT
jgi:hypothetical protein